MAFDPQMFAVDWERLAEALAVLVVLSFLVERALALMFESWFWTHKMQNRGLKEPIAFLVALLICWIWHFDVISILLTNDHTTVIGYFVTAGVIAGGSKASVKLFHDIMNVKSLPTREAEDAKKVQSSNPQA